jgi:hypothetical protein
MSDPDLQGKGEEASPAPLVGKNAAVADEGFSEEVGGLSFEQYVEGGPGRHLGVTSTTFLV